MADLDLPIRVFPGLPRACGCGRPVPNPAIELAFHKFLCQCGRSWYYNPERACLERRVHPIVFLDVDGVLITLQSKTVPDPRCVALLNRLVRDAQAAIVVSSSRRKGGLDSVGSQLSGWGIVAPVIDVTPELDRRMPSGLWESAARGQEIETWLIYNKRLAWRFVILDDEADMDELNSHLVRTDYRYGLTDREVKQALAMLSPPFDLST